MLNLLPTDCNLYLLIHGDLVGIVGCLKSETFHAIPIAFCLKKYIKNCHHYNRININTVQIQ